MKKRWLKKWLEIWLKKWQQKLQQNVVKKAGSTPYPFRLPAINKPADNDLSKQWCVAYGVWNKRTKAVERKRVVLAGETVKDRLAMADKLITFLTEYLKDGTAFVNENPKKKAVAKKGGRPKGSRNYADLQKKSVDALSTPTQPRLHLPVFEPTVQNFSSEQKNKLLLEPPVPALLASGPSPAKTGLANLTISQAKDDYITYVTPVLEGNTITRYSSSLNSLLEFLDRRGVKETYTLGEFSDIDASEYLDEVIRVEGNANRTRNNRMTDLFTVFEHFIKADRRTKSLTFNPFSDIAKLPCVSEKHQPYSVEEVDAYRKTCLEMGERGNELLFFVQFLYYTFTRPHAEARHLRIRDLQKSKIYIPGSASKNHKGDYIHLPQPLQQILEERGIYRYPSHYYIFSRGGEPGLKLLGEKYFYRRHVDVLTAIGLVDTLHDLYSFKHSGVRALWEATKDIELVKTQCRHQSIKQTIEYLRDQGYDMTEQKRIHLFPKF